MNHVGSPLLLPLATTDRGRDRQRGSCVSTLLGRQLVGDKHVPFAPFPIVP